MTSSHHGPYAQGYTRATMAATERGEAARRSRTQKGCRSSDRGIASNRASARRGEYVPGPCTHRPSHHPSRGYPKRAGQPFMGAAL